jgi:hypothetical protein
VRVIPLSLREANAYVDKHHRHHMPTRGHKLSIGAEINGELIGVAILGRPAARGCDHRKVIEVSRLCTAGARNVCSKLYSTCARIAKEMGYETIQTYILDSEPGITLKASGWVLDRIVKGRPWKHTAGPRRQDQPTCNKQCWVKRLT